MLSAAKEVELLTLFLTYGCNLNTSWELNYFTSRVMKSCLAFFLHFVVALHLITSVKCDEDDDVPDGLVADCGYSLRKAPKVSNIRELKIVCFRVWLEFNLLWITHRHTQITMIATRVV